MSWEDPKDDGGAMVTSYVIEKREAGKKAWSEASTCTQLEATVDKLTEGQMYSFRVAAVNECGTGPFTELKKSAAPKSQFSK